MKKWVLISIAILLVAITTIGCGAKHATITSTSINKDYEDGSANYRPPGITTTTGYVKPMPTDVYYQNAGGEISTIPEIDRMIVRTGNMTLVVDDIAGTINRITQIAAEHQGFVVSSQSWKEGQLLRGTISIRIVAGDYDMVVHEIGSLAVDITSQTTSSQDVTEEYIDLDAQLKNLQATEQQLLQVMAKAETVEDILAVQRELTNTRDSIERTQARMQYLERTSSYSLINIQLEQSRLSVDFNAYNTIVKVGEKVQFSPNIAGGSGPYTYEWDFGDKETGNEIAPTHIFKSAGTYTITLKVTDDKQNTETKVRKEYITVQPGWSAGNIARNAWNGLVIFGRVLANIFIWLGIFSPVWLIIGGIIYWRVRRRKKAGH